MDKVQSEIEQFHGLCDLVRNFSNPVDMSIDALLCLNNEIRELEAALAAAKAENERLREALEDIANLPHGAYHSETARRALEAKPNGKEDNDE